MSDAHRKVGGDNNKKGNRYEDAFAVFRLIQLAQRVTNDGVRVTVREQAGCPVDDFVFHEDTTAHYYQLKDDQQITWGLRDEKLRKEFVAQRQACKAAGEDHTLTVVVSHDHRKTSLDGSVPADLKGVVDVVHFPAVNRPSDLARRPELTGSLRHLAASRQPGAELLKGLVEGFHLAWVECERDESGVSDLDGMIAFVRARPWCRLRRPLPAPVHPAWDQFQEILAAVPGLSWYFDRGYFEWFLPPREAGLCNRPCDCEGFGRFVDRVIEVRPTTFEAFEGLLP